MWRRDAGSFSARFRLYAFLSLFCASIVCCSANAIAAPSKNVSIAVIPYVDGIPDADRAGTLLVSTILSYALDSFSGVSVIPDSIVKTSVGKHDIQALWGKNNSRAVAVMGAVRADAIVICRFGRAPGKTKQECVFYKKISSGASAEKFRAQGSASDAYKLRDAVLKEVLKRASASFTDDEVKKLWVEKSGAAVDAFADGLLKIYDGRSAQGLSSLEKIAASAAGFRDLQYYLGIYYADTQFDYQSSIKRMEAVIKKYPGDSGAHFQLGFVYRLKGDYGKAVDAFRKAVELKPGNYESHIHLAMIFYDSGDYEDCVSHYREALAIRSDAASVWYSLAGALVRTGKMNDALNAVKKAIELEPDTFRKIARRDMELAPLRKFPEFDRLVNEY